MSYSSIWSLVRDLNPQAEAVAPETTVFASFTNESLDKMVLGAGLEPACLSTREFETLAAANYANPALKLVQMRGFEPPCD